MFKDLLSQRLEQVMVIMSYNQQLNRLHTERLTFKVMSNSCEIYLNGMVIQALGQECLIINKHFPKHDKLTKFKSWA